MGGGALCGFVYVFFSGGAAIFGRRAEKEPPISSAWIPNGTHFRGSLFGALFRGFFIYVLWFFAHTPRVRRARATCDI